MTQTSIHLTVVTGERLFGDWFKTMLGEVGAKKKYIYILLLLLCNTVQLLKRRLRTGGGGGS